MDPASYLEIVMKHNLTRNQPNNCIYVLAEVKGSTPSGASNVVGRSNPWNKPVGYWKIYITSLEKGVYIVLGLFTCWTIL